MGTALPLRRGQAWLCEVSPFLDVPASAVGPSACLSAPAPRQEPRSPQWLLRARRAEQEEVDIDWNQRMFHFSLIFAFPCFLSQALPQSVCFLSPDQTFPKQVNREKHSSSIWNLV